MVTKHVVKIISYCSLAMNQLFRISTNSGDRFCEGAVALNRS